MKKIFLKIVIGVVLVCILFVCFLYTNNEIGVTSSKLETDIRSSQKIKDDWTVDGSVSSTMAAYISYPQDLSDHSFSVYVNRPGLSFGYFFRGGGTLSGIQRGIVEFTVEGYYERAFISMNQQRVTQLQIDDGNSIQGIYIDSNKPFAIVLPINAGTITFYEPESGSFGGLGHPICDADTGDILPFGSGEAAAVTISQVTKGVSGCAGMLQGSFSDDAPLGELLCNNRCGVFGTLYHNPSAEEAIPMALKQEIQTGAAQILCTVSGDTPKAYDITLEEIDYSGTDSTRNMTVCITDPELLEVTGGIVQGMSGSPILQNGKLVGAVTHVFVDDPTRGYGIFCENMVRYGLSGS